MECQMASISTAMASACLKEEHMWGKGTALPTWKLDCQMASVLGAVFASGVGAMNKSQIRQERPGRNVCEVVFFSPFTVNYYGQN